MQFSGLAHTAFVVAAGSLLLLLGSGVTSASESDAALIESLPGQPGNVTFRQFSGYVPVGDRLDRALFYYFAEADTTDDPLTKPLVLWLNGGPGCSSFGYGALAEHGPFKPSGGKLVKNDYSWNKEANMIYLESPAGVGFSYSNNKSYYDSINDAMTARDNLQFLKGWFETYPQYKNADLYLAGESYAGHYVPQLGVLVTQTPGLMERLKGIALGNALMEFGTDMNSAGHFWWSHGLVSDSTHRLMRTACNFSQFWREYRIIGDISPACRTMLIQAETEIGNLTNLYDVTLDVCLSRSVALLPHLPPTPRMLLSHEEASQLLRAHKPTTIEEVEVDVCIENEFTNYLQRQDVQKALHARLVGVGNWTPCAYTVIKYDTRDLEIPTIDDVGTLVVSGIRAMVYSGDQDAVIPLTGTRTLVDKLAKTLKLNKTVHYRNWIDLKKQVGGWTQAYGPDTQLTYATIKGASHMAPMTSPGRSLVLFRAFLRGTQLPNN